MNEERRKAVEKTQSVLAGILKKNNISMPSLSSLTQCESFIVDMVTIRRVSSLAIALMFVHIRDKQLFPVDETWEEYRANCKVRIGVSLADIWRYEAIGDAFVMYHSQLDRIGFAERGNVSKLMFLNRAVVQHGKKLAFQNFSKMSTLEFESWTKGKAVRVPFRGREFGITPQALLYQNHAVIRFDDIMAISRAGKLDKFKKMVQKLKRE